MAETAAALFKEIVPAYSTPHSKITVVGVGQVGMACAVSIMQKVASFAAILSIRFYGIL